MIDVQPMEALAYHDMMSDRSVRPIKHYLWKLEQVEPKEGEDWPDPTEVVELSRDDLVDLELGPHEKLYTEPAVFVVSQNFKDTQSVAILAHSFFRTEDGVLSWESRADVWFDNVDGVNRLIRELGEAKLKAWPR